MNALVALATLDLHIILFADSFINLPEWYYQQKNIGVRT